MSEYNYLENSYYPHHGPSKYSYTSDFGKDNNRGKTAAQAKANTSYSGLATQSGNKFKILFNLKLLVDGARAAELAFLADTGIDISSENVVRDIFKNFNLILSSQKLFERNLKMFEQISNGVNNNLIDPTKYFFTYLQQSIQKYGIAKHFNIKQASGPQLNKLLDNIMGEALERTYSRFREVYDTNGNIKSLTGTERINNRERYESMTEMVEIIRQLRGTGLFGKYASLINLEGLLKESTDASGTIIKKPKLSINSFDNGGTVLEIITSAITGEIAKIHYTNTSPGGTLTITGGQTGSTDFNLQKGDSMIAYAKGTIDFSEMQKFFKKGDKNDSTRLQNMKALEEYLRTVTDKIQHLLVISDKNYTINADWRGVHAQEKMTLANAQPMLERFGVAGVQGLIDYLANCGTDMIQGDVNAQVRTALASYIAYFLFDHLEITGTASGGTNVVNIINLSGTYIPLSVYLEGVYRSLENNLLNLSADSNNLVNVTISLGGNSPSTPWTSGAWESFRTGRETKSTLEYRIMQDIASYITGLMG